MQKARMVRLGTWLTAVMVVVLMTGRWSPVAAGGIDGGYRVLKPIQSGDLTLFPVVRADRRALPANQFLTLDEGLKSGEVEVTEAGKVRGLVRSRGAATPWRYAGDQVNTLVLVNNSKRPLILLAGEIVTGGKQDRVIAKDRIVPPGTAVGRRVRLSSARPRETTREVLWCSRPSDSKRWTNSRFGTL